MLSEETGALFSFRNKTEKYTDFLNQTSLPFFVVAPHKVMLVGNSGNSQENGLKTSEVSVASVPCKAFDTSAMHESGGEKGNTSPN